MGLIVVLGRIARGLIDLDLPAHRTLTLQAIPTPGAEDADVRSLPLRALLAHLLRLPRVIAAARTHLPRAPRAVIILTSPAMRLATCE